MVVIAGCRCCIGSIPLIVNVDAGRHTAAVCGTGVAGSLKLNLSAVDLDAVYGEHTACAEIRLSVYNLKGVKLYQLLAFLCLHSNGVGTIAGDLNICPLSIKIRPVAVVDVEVCRTVFQR